MVRDSCIQDSFLIPWLPNNKANVSHKTMFTITCAPLFCFIQVMTAVMERIMKTPPSISIKLTLVEWWEGCRSGWSWLDKWPKGVKCDLELIWSILNIFCCGFINQWQISGMCSTSRFLVFHQSHIEWIVSIWSDGDEVEGSVMSGLMDVICIVMVYPISPGANFCFQKLCPCLPRHRMAQLQWRYWNGIGMSTVDAPEHV